MNSKDKMKEKHIFEIIDALQSFCHDKIDNRRKMKSIIEYMKLYSRYKHEYPSMFIASLTITLKYIIRLAGQKHLNVKYIYLFYSKCFKIFSNIPKEVVCRYFEREIRKLLRLFMVLSDIGLFLHQFLLTKLMVEFFKYIPTKLQEPFLLKTFHGQMEVIQIFKQINNENFDNSCRIFLNKLNRNTAKFIVFSILANEVLLDNKQINSMCSNSNLWIDFNFGDFSITFFCESSLIHKNINGGFILINIPVDIIEEIVYLREGSSFNVVIILNKNVKTLFNQDKSFFANKRELIFKFSITNDAKILKQQILPIFIDIIMNFNNKYNDRVLADDTEENIDNTIAERTNFSINETLLDKNLESRSSKQEIPYKNTYIYHDTVLADDTETNIENTIAERTNFCINETLLDRSLQPRSSEQEIPYKNTYKFLADDTEVNIENTIAESTNFSINETLLDRISEPIYFEEEAKEIKFPEKVKSPTPINAPALNEMYEETIVKPKKRKLFSVDSFLIDNTQSDHKTVAMDDLIQNKENEVFITPTTNRNVELEKKGDVSFTLDEKEKIFKNIETINQAQNNSILTNLNGLVLLQNPYNNDGSIEKKKTNTRKKKNNFQKQTSDSKTRNAIKKTKLCYNRIQNRNAKVSDPIVVFQPQKLPMQTGNHTSLTDKSKVNKGIINNDLKSIELFDQNHSVTGQKQVIDKVQDIKSNSMNDQTNNDQDIAKKVVNTRTKYPIFRTKAPFRLGTGLFPTSRDMKMLSKYTN